MLENQFVFEAEPISRELRRRRPRRDLGFRTGPYDREFDFEAPPVAACGSYGPGEVERSNTEGGHLPADLVTGPLGNPVIADFAVRSPVLKRSARSDPNLKAWLESAIQTAAQDSTAIVRLVGYTDCVNKENRNVQLRIGRANAVLALVRSIYGRDPRWNRVKGRIRAEGAPVEQYLADNASPASRATNRGVSLQLERSISFDAEDFCDNHIKTVTVWINAFIPRDIVGRTRAVPAIGGRIDRRLVGKTMFDTNFGCGLTDQRSFSTDPNISSRMHSQAKIDLVMPRIIDQKHRIDPSVQLHCMTGVVLCDATSPVPSDTKYTWVGVSADNEVMVKVDGSQGPACPKNALIKKAGQVLLDAQIDYHGTFFIKRTVMRGKRLKNYVDIGFLGKVDLFPAYEFVVQINDSPPVHLGGVLPKPHSSPVTHLGTSRKVHFIRRLSLACKDGKQVARVEQNII